MLSVTICNTCGSAVLNSLSSCPRCDYNDRHSYDDQLEISKKIRKKTFAGETKHIYDEDGNEYYQDFKGKWWRKGSIRF